MLPFDEEQQSFNKSPLDEETLLSGQFWGELRVFLAVAKTKSFNRAAEITNTSQPTVSRQVKRLQDVVGSQLFISTPRGVKLTQKGEALAQALSRLDYTLYSITSDLKAETREAEGTVRVSITDGLNALFAAPRSMQFSEEYPKIQLHLKNPINMMSLRENQTDMMIGFSPSESSDIQFQKTRAASFYSRCRKDYIQKHGLPTRDNLEQHLFIQSEYYLAKNRAVGWLAAGRGTRTHRTLLRQFLCIRHAGEGREGNRIACQLYAGRAGSSLGNRLKDFGSLYLIALTDRLKARPVRLVFDWLSEVFGRKNPWFSGRIQIE